MAVDPVLIDSLGVVAGALVLVSFVPQIVRSYRTKKMKDISPLLMVLIMSGMVLWIAYGLIRQDMVIVGANVVGAGLNATLLAMKFRYSGKIRKK